MAKPVGSGFIVGRFQVYELNKVHEQLFAHVWAKHVNLYAIICSNPAPSSRNPLDWELRRALFAEKYGDKITVLEMPDLHDDRIWSQELDRRILALHPKKPIVLYGSADRFVAHYCGQFPCEPLEAAREGIEQLPTLTPPVSLRDFCAGAIYGAMRRYPTVYPTVDVALFTSDYRCVLLARKPNETRMRFPGGFVDPEDDSFEEAALRELEEECGPVEVGGLTYLGSCRIDDWRYRDSPDAVMSHLYACAMVSGKVSAGDDVFEVRWCDMRTLTPDQLVPEHRPLFALLRPYWEEQIEALL